MSDALDDPDIASDPVRRYFKLLFHRNQGARP